MLLGEPFGPAEAVDIGLATKVVGKGQLDEALAETVVALLAKPAEALRQTQRLLRHGTSDELLERFELENSHFSERLQSDEVKRVIAAFFEQRKSKP